MRRLAACLLATAAFAAPANAISFVDYFTVANGTDLSDPAIVGSSADARLFGGFGSDLIYNATDGLYYGMTDRGPGGGFLEYAPRIQAFSLDTTTGGDITGFQLQKTVVFTDFDGQTFNGQNPGLLAGDKSVLGKSFDPEGLTILSNGNFLVADEYGPSVYEFGKDGKIVRKFETPANIIPKQAGTPNYVDGRPTITDGRQDNRGFEGLTLSNDGTKAYAILQDPLVDEGPVNNNEAQGRRGRNLRIVEFDVASGEATAQYVYQLENRADINNRVPGSGDPIDFSANQQGRSIGASSIVALPDGRFAVIERDNRGWGVDPAVNSLPIGSKRVYIISLDGATDVSNVSLEGLANLPNGVIPVVKEATPTLDIQMLLAAAGVPIVEKMEGLAFSPVQSDGGRLMFVISDNDFSVTQLEGSPNQFYYCSTDPTSGGNMLVSLTSTCPQGTSLIPTFIYSFKLSRGEAAALGFSTSVPEPATWAMMIAGFGLVGAAVRGRRRWRNVAA